MAVSLKTLGSCEAAAPVFGATAVFTVTAVKLPWEERDKRRREENNGLSCNLHMSKDSEEVCVCLYLCTVCVHVCANRHVCGV